MSKGKGLKGGSWISQNYDKLLLVVALVALLGSAAFLVLKVSADRAALSGGAWDAVSVTPKGVEPVDLSPYSNAVLSLVSPLQIPPDRQRMMVGELRVASVPDGNPIPYTAAVDPFTQKPQPEVRDPTKFDGDGDGIPDEAERKLGFNPMDPTDGSADNDGDQFTNVEEVHADSDPLDPASFPPPSAKLRLVRVAVDPFKFRFLSVSKLANGDRFQLNLRSLERTYFAKLGDEVEGFTVTTYDDKAAEGPTLTLDAGGKTIRLVQGKVIQQDAKNATLVSLLDRTIFRGVRIGQIITVKDLGYKVVDIANDRVVIRDEQAGKDATVGLLSEEEKARLRGESAPDSASIPMEQTP